MLQARLSAPPLLRIAHLPLLSCRAVHLRWARAEISDCVAAAHPRNHAFKLPHGMLQARLSAPLLLRMAQLPLITCRAMHLRMLCSVLPPTNFRIQIPCPLLHSDSNWEGTTLTNCLGRSVKVVRMESKLLAQCARGMFSDMLWTHRFYNSSTVHRFESLPERTSARTTHSCTVLVHADAGEGVGSTAPARRAAAPARR